MTKPVICRIIQSRPLSEAGVFQLKAPTDLPKEWALSDLFQRDFRRQFPIDRISPKAPRGIWIDCLA
jgi:hypothetical protein